MRVIVIYDPNEGESYAEAEELLEMIAGETSEVYVEVRSNL